MSEFPTVEELGSRELEVTFEKQPEKYEGANAYDVFVEGVSVGWLFREYAEGVRVPRAAPSPVKDA